MSAKALVVGINKYAPPNSLPSCVNDAENFSDLLSSTYHFDEITKLFDEDAKRANIASALGELFDGAQPDDCLVFFYSGHGYTHKVGSVVEEALVGQDLKFYNSSDLLEAMQDLPDGILTIVLDSCFSGGMEKYIFMSGGEVEQIKIKRYAPVDQAERTKELVAPDKPIPYIPFGFSRTVRPSTLAKHFELPSKKALRKSGIPAQKGPSLLTQVVSLQDPGSRGLLLSACKSDETAAASTSDTNGLSAFTFCLLESINQLGADSTSSDLLGLASQKLADIGVPQTPLLKEPIEPDHLGARAFVTLEPRKPAGAASQEVDKDLLNAIRQILEEILGKVGARQA
jgi:hypothetical protein